MMKQTVTSLLLLLVGLAVIPTATAFSPGAPSLTPLRSVPAASFSSRSSTRIFQSTKSESTQTSTQLEESPISSDALSMDLALAQAEDNQQLLQNVVLVNGVVLSVVGLSVLYALFHVDIKAIIALWYFDLGEHGPSVTKMGVTLDLMARQPLDWIQNYEALVPTNPIFYKACTSGVAYALGDFVSQVYQGSNLKTLDLPRSLRSGAAGFIAHGPLCHFWLLFMETYLDFGGAWWATGIKVTADLTVWSIFLNAAYSLIIGLLAFRNPKEVLGDVKVTLWPALRSAWRFWPFVHTISFSHAVPLDLKLLWVDVMEVVWVTILSKVANEDKIKRMEENPEEMLASANLSKEVPECDPSVEIELTRELETTDAKNLAFELPQKVLAACWPLIVMWPVLYAGYRVEVMLGLEV